MLIQKPQSRRARRRLRRASAARASIEHPNVVRATLHSKRDGRIGIIVERCPQPALSELPGPLDPEECVRILRGACLAVHALGDSGLVARDLTPEHVYVHPTTGGLLADSALPLAVVPRVPTDEDPYLAYRAPEELNGEPPDARSSVYSLGAVLFRALTGRAPFGGAWSKVYLAHHAATRPRPSSHRDGLPETLDDVVARAMAVAPADRYAAPHELAEALTAAVAPPSADASNGSHPVAPTPSAAASVPAPEPAQRGLERREAEVTPRGAPEVTPRVRTPARNARAAAPSGKPSRTRRPPPAGKPRSGKRTAKPHSNGSAPKLGPARRVASRPGAAALEPHGVASALAALRVRAAALAILKPLAVPSQSNGRPPSAQKTRLRGSRPESLRTLANLSAPTLRMGRARVAVVAAVTTAAVVATLLVFGNGGDERGWAGRLTGERVQKDRRQAPVPVPIAPRKPRYPVPRGVIRDLLHARSLARTRLANAAFAEDQAAAARSLQVYYRQAARRIQLSALPGDRGDALVAALRDTNAAYARLAASILAGDQIAFDEARGAIEAGEAAVWRAVWRAVPEATGQLSGGSS